MDDLVPLAIMFTGVIAVFLTQQSSPSLKKYACLFGLFGLFAHPFWFYATYQAGQWGIFMYMYSWLMGVGVYNNWIKK